MAKDGRAVTGPGSLPFPGLQPFYLPSLGSHLLASEPCPHTPVPRCGVPTTPPRKPAASNATWGSGALLSHEPHGAPGLSEVEHYWNRSSLGPQCQGGPYGEGPPSPDNSASDPFPGRASSTTPGHLGKSYWEDCAVFTTLQPPVSIGTHLTNEETKAQQGEGGSLRQPEHCYGVRLLPCRYRSPQAGENGYTSHGLLPGRGREWRWLRHQIW